MDKDYAPSMISMDDIRISERSVSEFSSKLEIDYDFKIEDINIEFRERALKNKRVHKTKNKKIFNMQKIVQRTNTD